MGGNEKYGVRIASVIITFIPSFADVDQLDGAIDLTKAM
jgi:hypothetical protein